MTSGTEPQRQAITGVPQAMASIITSPNGSGQSIGNSSASAPPRKADFSASPISPTNSTSGSCEQRLDLVFEVGPVGVVDLGRDPQRAGPARLAMAIARSGRFSGEMRPRKAR